MKKFRFTFFSLLSVLAFSEANAVEERQEKFAFNSEIFSLSKKKESAFDASSATYVLSSEDIRRSGATSIPEALRLVPGVDVARIDGNKYAISARGFTRQFSNKMLIMFDGRILYTTLFSGVFLDIHDYVLEDIDKIEVIRGPGASIWGANAVNGIINIITKSAAQTQGIYASQIVGTQDKSITEMRYGGETKSEDHYRVYVKKVVRDGLDRVADSNGIAGNNRDGMNNERAGFRYDINSISGSAISVHGDAYSGTAYNYFNGLNNPDKNDKDSRGGNIVVNWDKRISKKSSFSLQSYFDYDQFHIPVLQRSAKTTDIDFQHSYSFSKDNGLAWGLGYRNIIDDIEESDVNGSVPLNYSTDHRNDAIYSAFLQEKYGIIADKLYLTVGAKLLLSDFSGFENQPNARLTYFPSKNQTVWASVSRAVRLPTRGELDLDAKAPNSSLTVNKGSSTFQSETVVAYEAGYRIKPNYKTLIDATAFYNDYSRLRTFEPTGAGGTPTVANMGYGESYGFEITGKWQATKDWKLEANYDFLKMTLHLSDQSNDIYSLVGNSDSLEMAEGQAPQNQFKLKSFYNITPNLEFDNILYYVSGLPTAGGSTTSTDRRLSGIPSYVRFDTRLGYLPTKNLDLSVGVQDLFNQTHTEFKPALYQRRTEVGRTAYVKIVWRY